MIDDSLSIRKFVGRMLESAGYEVDTAVDGEDGLRKASAQNYRLIITDLEMPKLNGYEVIQGLRSRAQTQQTPIIVMTTRAGDKHRQMALNIGASAYITKPVDERALIQEVERWIGKEAAARKLSNQSFDPWSGPWYRTVAQAVFIYEFTRPSQFDEHARGDGQFLGHPPGEVAIWPCPQMGFEAFSRKQKQGTNRL